MGCIAPEAGTGQTTLQATQIAASAWQPEAR